ncbi:putative glycine cleavage system H protein, mitochondrial precursor [Cladochytrium replicatum]|nr:putative glycine cleavage system H protein, mitochondrial precursor [Cladochytrium replicatum]
MPVIAGRFAAAFRAVPSRSFAIRQFSIARQLLERKYTSDHEWVTLSGDGKIATIGITDFAQNALGDVVFAEIPAVGKQVKQSDPIGAVESVKAASDIYAPLSGTIVESNEGLKGEPQLLNSSPYEKGWYAKIEISSKSEYDALLDEAAYNAIAN